ncbi:hypothetical protein ECE50_024365 [Chitinophaga sp. Mgbs1]|uniref:Uncharacterized protein n=1 Tax=Chitinophaga solisilvae TaxID=1233460 RepID=A0A433WCN2_9BACT|nr:hypothetical protein [Chitinophaga solisilvae]
MKLLLAASLLCCIIITANARQRCNCERKLDSLKLFVENNYAGFSARVTTTGLPAYQAEYDTYRRQAARINSEKYCYYLLGKWINAFNDKNLHISGGRFAPDSLPLTVDRVRDLYLKTAADIEGIYQQGSVYTIAVVKSARGLRTYAGVIIHSAVGSWQPGHVKLELIPAGYGYYDVIMYGKDYGASRGATDTTALLAAQGWKKVGRNVVAAPRKVTAAEVLFPEETSGNAYYRQLDSSTGYLRLKSVSAASIDSVISAHSGQLRRNARMVLDLRDNNGGTDLVYRSIRPLLYTGPWQLEGDDFLATPENIRRFEQEVAAAESLPSGEREKYRQLIHRSDTAPGKFIPFTPDETITLPEVLPYPARIAVIMNRNSAGAAEQLIIESRKSSKVKRLGEPATGAADAAGCCHKQFYSPDLILAWPVTRSRRITAGEVADGKGIQPDVKVDLSRKGWLEEVLKQL